MRFQPDFTLRYFLLVPVIGFLSLSASAQQKKPISEEVDVIRQYKPVLGDAVKIKKSPSYFDEATQAAPLKYTFKNLRLLKDTARLMIAADSLRKTDSLNTPFLYLKAGGGNLSTALGEIYLNSKPQKNGNYGAWFKHLSQQGKLANQQFLHEQVNIFGKKIMDHNFISGNLSGEDRKVYFYGYDHKAVSYSKAASKQSLQNIDATVEFGSNADTSSSFYYGLKAHGLNFKDTYSNKENTYEGSGFIGYKIGQFSFNLSSALSSNKASLESGSVFNTSMFRIEPYITLENKIFKIKAGLNVVNDFGQEKKVQIFPDASIDFLLSYGFNVYGGIKGDVVQNTYNGLTRSNPWMRGIQFAIPAVLTAGQAPLNTAPLNLLNTKQKIDFFGGIKGAFSPEFNYRAQVETGVYDNYSFFINNPLDTRYFSLAYDGKGTTKEEFYAEINYLAGSKFRLNANLDYLTFKLKNLSQPWHTPKLKTGLLISYNPSSQWLITGSAYYTGTQKAVANGSNGNVKKLPAFTDLNLGVEYRINKKVSLFLNGNNLLNKQYQNYLNYPVLGFNVFGGITLNF